MNLVMSLLLVTLLISSPLSAHARTRVGAQQTQAAPKPARQGRTPEQLDALRQTALGAIVKEVERAESYTQASARILVWTAAADALWEFDAEKGRELLRNAYKQIERAAVTPLPGESKFMTSMRASSLQGRLRADILAVAHRRDPELVKELTGAAEEKKTELISLHNEPKVFGSSSFQKKSIAMLAARVAQTDPERAVELAAESLGYGVPHELTDVFRALIAASPAQARRLFEKVVDSFVADSSPNLFDAMIASSYLRLIPEPEPDVRLVRKFLAAALDRVVRVREQSVNGDKPDEGLRSTLFLSLNQLQIFYRIYWPEKAGEVGSLAQQLVPDLKPGEVAAEELFPTETSRDDVESILGRAEKEKNEDNRDALFFQAALTLSKKGEHRRALETVARARDGERRQAVTAHLHREEAKHFIARGELFDALKVSEKIESPEERADVSLLLITAARKNKDVQLAADVLNGALKLFAGKPGSVRHARAHLWLASSYCAVDAAAGFELMAAAVKAANETKGLEDVRAEPKLLQLGGASRHAIEVGDSKGDFRPGFRLLARSDLGRAISLAERFDNELLRGVAVVTAAASVLKEKPKPIE
ncbi:MAG: hypothetical protein LC802_10960 [Acidobacteria bacterium]|nr:hypothetical protein [Acidobacteriota bacterium]